MFRSFFYSYEALIAIALSWIFAQVLKATIKKINDPQQKWFVVFLWRTGGMPSSHSAIVLALVTHVGLRQGFSSLFFALTLGYAAIVLRDALGIRRTVGFLVERITTLEHRLKLDEEHYYKPMKTLHGHGPLEVFLGACLGFCISLFLYLFLGTH